MTFIITKIFITACLIVLISEVAKINDRLGGLIAAMPITTILIIMWLKIDNVPNEKIANHITYTLLYVLPTIPMFIIFPKIIDKLGFFYTTTFCIVITIFFVIIVDYFFRRFGFKIF